jgi:hypothetical protein
MANSHVLIAIAMRVVTVETIASERAGRIAVVYYSARGAADLRDPALGLATSQAMSDKGDSCARFGGCRGR